MEALIKILILEHDPNDIGLLQYELKRNNLNYTSVIVQTKQDYEEALKSFGPDIILSDYSLPTFDGLSAFKIKQNVTPETPFIIVSGTIGDENAVELIKLGITDYALKDKMYQVIPKIHRALKEAKGRKQREIAELQLREREKHLQKIMDLSLDLICTVDKDGRFVTVSAASKYILNCWPEELVGTRVIDIIHNEDKDKVYNALADLRNGRDIINLESRYIRKDATTATLLWSARWDVNDRLGYCVARDVTGIKKAEAEHQEHNELVNNIIESISEGFFAVNENWEVIYWNKVAEEFLQVPKEDILGKNLWELFSEEISSKSYKEYHRALSEHITVTFEDYYPPFDSWFEVTASPLKSGLVVAFRDITEKKRKQQLDLLEKNMLEFYTANKYTLSDAVSYLLKGMQELYPEMMFSVLEAKNGVLTNWVSPSLPIDYSQELVNIKIEPGLTACGTAAFLKEKIIVSDIETEPLWKDFKDVAVRNGLKACSSYPILDTNKNVLGTLAVYFREQRAVNEVEELAIERVLTILKPLIESKNAEMALARSEEKYRSLFDINPAPMWVFDLETYHFLDVNEAAIKSYGYSKEEFLSMNLFDIRPAEDADMLIESLKAAASTGEAANFLQAITRHIKKSGEIIYVDVQAKTFELKGKKARVALATDISERLKYIKAIEEQNVKLRDIAWMQSHVVRAPLARIMGLVNLLNNYSTEKINTSEILTFIHHSAHELDGIIREIVKKTEQIEEQEQAILKD